MQSAPRPLVAIGLIVGTLLVALRPKPVSPADTDPILEALGEAATVYLAPNATTVQDAFPQVGQRGVQLDGMLRSPPHQEMAIYGNPFEDVWREPSVGGIRLDLGTYAVQDVDIALPAEGFSWVVGRGFNARQQSGGSHRNSNGYQGRNWFQTSQPEIVFYDHATNTKDMVYLIYGADRFLEYKRVANGGNTFKGTNGAAGVFLFTDGGGGPDTYKLTDQEGNELTFFGFDGDAGVAGGQLWKIVDPDGNTAYIGHATTAATAITDGFDGSGRIELAFDPSGRRYTYSYTTLDSVVRLTQVLAEKNTGSWVTVGKVEYSYYTTAESNGEPGDLKVVKVTTPLTDSGVELVSKKYYRYWEGTYNASTNPGYDYALKYVVDFEGVRRFDWQDTTFDDDHLSASDGSLQPYATAYFEYDSSHRIREAWFNGECGCSGASNGTYEIEYETNGSFSDTSNVYDATWKTRTVVKRPDLSYLTQYWDEVNQPLSQVITDDDPDNTGPAPSRWVTAVTRDSNGFVTQVATPANCTGYTHSSGSISSSSSVGLVWSYTRINSGSRLGFVSERKFKEGTSGTAYYDQEWEFTQASKVMASGQTGETHVIRPAISKVHRYQVQGTSTGNRITTTYAPTFHSGTLQKDLDRVDKPAVASGKNGSNSSLRMDPYFRLDGTPSYVKARDGILGYQAYTDGQLTTSIEDADTSILSDEPAGLSSTGTPLHRVTTYSYDKQGRRDVATHPDGRKIKNYYSKLADGRLVTLQYNDFETTPKFYGPVSYTVTNQGGEVEARATVALTSNESTTVLTGHVDETDTDPITALDLGTVAKLTTNIYNESGETLEESRLYFSVPGSGAGSDGTNYDATFYGYDDSGRRVRTKAPHGTITATVFDKLGRVASRWTGTNDPLEGGTDNMIQVEALEYDGGNDDGNGYLTARIRFIQGDSTGQRVTTYSHDARGRVLLETRPETPHAFHKYDNEGRRLATGLYSSTASISVSSDDPTTETANRLALTESAYDEVGQLWKTVRHKIDAADGSDDDSLDSLTWYDAEGRMIKEKGAQHAKTIYDRLGRQTHRFVLAENNDSVYADADDVSGDSVLEEYQSVYDDNNDDVLMQLAISRMHTDWGGGSTTGALDTNSDGDVLLVTDGNMEGRVQITALWYDRFGRKTDEVQYGNYNGSNFDRDGLSVPSRSDTALVTSYAYDTDGTLQSVTDPRALVMRYEYDDTGRKTKEITNYNSGVNSGNPANPDDNQTVRYEYTDGLRTKTVADMPSGETDQETLYIYGSVIGTPSAMKVASGHLLRAIRYPDSGNSGDTLSEIDSDTSDVVSYAYNVQSERTYQKDQAGNVIETNRDDAGREEHRRVTTLISGFDGAVRRVSRTFDDLGRSLLVTQYDNATVGSGSVTDEVKYTYEGWGNVSAFQQDKDGVVGGSGYYQVSYVYAKATGGRNTICRSSMTLPSGNEITIDYSDNADASISRVSKLKDDSLTLVTYDYLGAGRVVGTIYPEPDISNRVYDPLLNGLFPGYLDRFDRIVKSRWASDIATPVNFYEAEISYDRNSNITWVEDNVHSGFDVKYTMDELDRLSDAEEGTRSGGSITTRKRHQTWTTLTHTGNWSRAKLDLDGDDNWNETNEYDDTRTHNTVNELTAQDLDSTPGTTGNNYTLSYDAVGNLTNDAKDYEYVYDAFGRLRQVKNQSSTVVGAYGYNGLGFMKSVLEDTDSDGDADGSDITFYPAYDEGWREVARYRAGDSSPKEEFVNALAGLDGLGDSSYINDVVCRNKDANTAWTSASDGVLEERFYYCPNWRGDVSALIYSTRVIGEWGKYSPYGVPNSRPGGDTNSDGDCDNADIIQLQTWINASAYDVRGDIDLDGDVDIVDKNTAVTYLHGITLGWKYQSNTAILNRRGIAGYEHHAIDSMHVRNRDYDPSRGRWPARDRLGYVDGSNLYAYGSNSPLITIDPSGNIPVSGQAGNVIYYVWFCKQHPLHPKCTPPQVPGGPSFKKSCCDQTYDGLADTHGWIACCGGLIVLCTRFEFSPSDDPSELYGRQIIRNCAAAHEFCHIRNFHIDLGKCLPGHGNYRPPFATGVDQDAAEHQCYQEERDCLELHKGGGPTLPGLDCEDPQVPQTDPCVRAVQGRINGIANL